MRLNLRVVTSCVLILTFETAAAQKLQAPLPVDDMLASWSFPERMPISVSPDSQLVAYTLQSQASQKMVIDKRFALYDRKGVSFEGRGRVVWVTEIKSGKAKCLIKRPNSSWAPTWSPDGRHLAFYSDSDGQPGIWVWERATDTVRRVSRAIVRPLFGFESPQWTPDSKSLIVKVLPEGFTIENTSSMFLAPTTPPASAPAPKKSSVIVYPSEAGSNEQAAARLQSLVTRSLADLVLIDVASDGTKTLARGSATTAYFVSPDGSHVAYTNIKGKRSVDPQEALRDIAIVSLSNASPRVIVSNVRLAAGRELSWSPDGKFLSYITTSELASEPRTTGNCYIVSIDGGEPRNLTNGRYPEFGDNSFNQPLWSADGKTIYTVGDGNLWSIPVNAGKPSQVTKELGRDVLEIVASLGKGRIWSPDGHSAYICVRNRETKQVGFYKIDLSTGEHSVLTEESKTYGSPICFNLDGSGNGRSIIYVAEDARHCADLWAIDVDSKAPFQISHMNPQLDKYEMGPARLIEWKGENGEKLQGSLLLPAGYQDGKRYPMIVEVYGDDVGSNHINRFGMLDGGIANKQLLATRGYAVFWPDLPLQVGTPVRDLVKNVLSGVNKVIELGIADPNRLGITGKSYGGYCTLAIITQTSIFKAAVSRSGHGNMISNYLIMGDSGNGIALGWAEAGQGRMGGTLWQYKDRYLENSPIFYLDKITTPLLLVSGAADFGVPPHLTEEVFIGLRRLGKEVIYAKYQEGAHTEESFNYADSMDYFDRMLKWFDGKLKWASGGGSTGIN